MATTVPAPVASTSTSTPPPPVVVPSSNGTVHQPQPLPAYQRQDLDAIKQELHDVLGENGLPYWRALNGYLLGQLSRDELVALVKKWLKGPQLQLHNNLLVGLLYNASIPSASAQSPGSANAKKRRRLDVEGPDFDTDDTNIEPKARVNTWVMGLTGKERMRIRRAVLSRDDDADNDDNDDWDLRRRRVSNFAPTAALPPLASSDRQLPSAQQLSLRLSSIAKSYDLTLATDATSELGEFMAVGMDSHVGDILHNLVRLTSSNRRGVDTIRVNSGNKLAKRFPDVGSDHGHDVHVKQEDEEMPKPDLNALQYLVAMIPDIHQQASPALYKLQTSHLKGEVEVKTEPTEPPRPVSFDAEGSAQMPPPLGARANTERRISPPKPTVGLPGSRRAEATRERLTTNELLKLDRGREEGEGKKSKHPSHWRYEDPALIFKDILG